MRSRDKWAAFGGDSVTSLVTYISRLKQQFKGCSVFVLVVIIVVIVGVTEDFVGKVEELQY